MNPASLFNNRNFRFLLFLVIIVLCFILGQYFHPDLEYLRHFFKQFPPVISGFIFVVSYVVITFFIWFGPKDVFRILAALLFGPYVSTLYVWLAEIGNVFVLFHFARKLGQEFIVNKFNLDKGRLEKTKGNTGFLWVMALRMNPLFPVRFLDLSFGLSTIPFKKYLTVSIISTLPRIFWLQYIIAGIGEGIFEGAEKMMEFLLANPFLIKYSFIYFLTVGVMTLAAIILQFINNRKKASL